MVKKAKDLKAKIKRAVKRRRVAKKEKRKPTQKQKQTQRVSINLGGKLGGMGSSQPPFPTIIQREAPLSDLGFLRDSLVDLRKQKNEALKMSQTAPSPTPALSSMNLAPPQLARGSSIRPMFNAPAKIKIDPAVHKEDIQGKNEFKIDLNDLSDMDDLGTQGAFSVDYDLGGFETETPVLAETPTPEMSGGIDGVPIAEAEAVQGTMVEARPAPKLGRPKGAKTRDPQVRLGSALNKADRAAEQMRKASEPPKEKRKYVRKPKTDPNPDPDDEDDIGKTMR